MQRVLIVGQPGSGKSTLAIALADKTGLPLYHMDHIHFLPGWVPRDAEEKTAMTKEIHRKPAWILEGGHSATYGDRLAHADTVIWLDVGLALRFWRVTRRIFQYYGRNRPDMPPGCPEVVGAHTLEFYHFIWRTRKTSRARIARLLDAAPPGVDVHVLTSLSDVERFLADPALA